MNKQLLDTKFANTEPPTIDDISDGDDGDGDGDDLVQGWFDCFYFLCPDATREEADAAFERFLDSQEDYREDVLGVLYEHGPMTVGAIAEAIKHECCCGAEECQARDERRVTRAIETLVADETIEVVEGIVKLAGPKLVAHPLGDDWAEFPEDDEIREFKRLDAEREAERQVAAVDTKIGDEVLLGFKHDDGQIIYWRASVLHREGDTFIGSTAEASPAVREHFGDSITFGPEHIARNVTTQEAA